MRNATDKSYRENQNAHFMFHDFFLKIMPFMTWGKKWYSQTGHRWKYNVAQNRCKNTHTLMTFNTYCFTTATMVTRMHLNVTLYVHWLPCF